MQTPKYLLPHWVDAPAGDGAFSPWLCASTPEERGGATVNATP